MNLLQLYSPLNFNQNNIQEFVFENLSEAPTNPIVGRVYYNTSSNTLQIYNGGSWTTLSNSGSVIDTIITSSITLPSISGVYNVNGSGTTSNITITLGTPTSGLNYIFYGVGETSYSTEFSYSGTMTLSDGTSYNNQDIGIKGYSCIVVCDGTNWIMYSNQNLKNLSIGGTETVTGLLTANGGITTTGLSTTSITNSGNSTISGTETVTGLLTANGGITTTGLSTTSITNSGNSTISGTETVTGLFKANGGVNTSWNIYGKTTFPTTGLTIGWDFTNSQGEVDLLLGPQGGSGGLNLYQLNSSGNMVSTTPIFALSNAGALTLQGNLTIPSISISGNSTISGTNIITGLLTANGGITTTGLSTTSITNSGNSTISGTETVTGLFKANGGTTTTSIINSGNSSIGGTETVTGLLTANGGITTTGLSASSITNSGNSTISGTETVTGLLTANGGVTVNNISNLESIKQVNTIQNQCKLFQSQDWISNIVISGLSPATSSTLTSVISAGIAYVSGVRVVTSDTSYTYTASSNTYIDLDSTGTFHYTAVTTGSTAPGVTVDSIRIAEVVTSASAITSVVNYNTFNVFLGYSTGINNTTGSSNIFLGNQSGTVNTTGSSNLFMGNTAGYSNTTGMSNIFLGYQTGYSNSVGTSNVFLGTQTGFSNTNGGYNIFLGNYTGMFNTTGINNVFLGYQTGYSTTTGSSNVFLGAYAGTYISGGTSANTLSSNSIMIGSNTMPLASGDTNEIVIGYNTTGKGSNTVMIGNSSMTWIGGQVGWTTVSDARLKENIKDNNLGLDFITQLNPVDFNFKPVESISFKNTKNQKSKKIIETFHDTTNRLGLLAQDVEKITSDFPGIHTDINGYKSITYSDFIMPLINAVKELNNKLTKLEEKIVKGN